MSPRAPAAAGLAGEHLLRAGAVRIDHELAIGATAARDELRATPTADHRAHLVTA